MIERDYAPRNGRSTRLRSKSFLHQRLHHLERFLYGCIALAQGDVNSARKFFETARIAYETAVRESPDSAERHAIWIDLCLSWTERGRDSRGRRAVELKPESLDAVDGALMSAYLP